MVRSHLRTTHGEANVIVVPQMVHFPEGVHSILVISDESDVLLLLHFVALES